MNGKTLSEPPNKCLIDSHSDFSIEIVKRLGCQIYQIGTYA